MIRRSFSVILLLSVLGVGCSTHRNIFRVTELGWQGDSVRFKIAQIDSTAGREHLSSGDVDCLSCNTILPPFPLRVDSLGIGRVLVPEANYSLTARLHLRASGLDTLLLVKLRDPKTAEKFYKLTEPLIGRVLTTEFSILYADSLAAKTATHAEPGDEINIFAETPDYFLVMHPLFPQPLYLRKSSAIRLF